MVLSHIYLAVPIISDQVTALKIQTLTQTSKPIVKKSKAKTIWVFSAFCCTIEKFILLLSFQRITIQRRSQYWQGVLPLTMRKNLLKVLDLLIFCIYLLNFSLKLFAIITHNFFFVTNQLNISKFLLTKYVKPLFLTN